MKTRIVSVLLLVLVATAAHAQSSATSFGGPEWFPRYGDMPYLWAQYARVFTARGGDQDELMANIGCAVERSNSMSVQCFEAFQWIGPTVSTPKALSLISNIQVEGYVEEARTLTTVIETRDAGRVDRGVILSAHCVGNVGSCVVQLGHGWELRAREDRLEIVAPGGQVRNVWGETTRVRRPRKP